MENQQQNNKLNSLFSNGKIITVKDIKEGKVDEYYALPSNKESDILDFFNKLNNNKLVNDLDDESKFTLLTKSEELNYTNKKDVGYRGDITDLDNEPVVDDKILKLKTLSPKLKNNATSIKLKLKEKLGIGGPVHVPLWHSGFWVTLEPLNKEETINLYLELATDINTVLKTTHGLMLSQENFLYVRPLMRTILNKVIDTSLIIDDIDDLPKYIKIQDLPILAWGLLQSMYPKGINYLLSCSNSVEIENGQPKCNYKQVVKLDISKMLFVDISKLTLENKQHMLKRGSRSVTIEEVEKYQKSLSVNQSDSISIIVGDDDSPSNIVINIGTPTIDRYIELGELLYNDILEKSSEIINKLTGNLTDEELNREKESAKQVILNLLILRIYQHYIDSIVVDGKTIINTVDIGEILELLSEDEKINKRIIDGILKYIDNNLLAIIGLPGFICPNCKEYNANLSNNFKSFIGVDVFSYFFTLLVNRFKMTTESH